MSDAVKYESIPPWMGGTRRFEAAETNRLNSAHWTWAQDESINSWLSTQLETLRARATYECKQNGMVLGMVNTHADDVVGQDGPTLQVMSDDVAYNDALEALWGEWFAAPTPDTEMSGAAWLKQAVKGLWKEGEFFARIVTDPLADTSVALRVQPLAARLIDTPADLTGNDNVFMGIRCNSLRRPTQYYVYQESLDGLSTGLVYETVPADLMIHKFIVEEPGQLRGLPWLNTSLQPSADLRDYDDQVQDAARQIADQTGILYTDRDDIPTWTAPENVDVERRRIRTAPPGWKPFVYPAVQPPVQYPDYRAERMREFGRPAGMPLATIRLDYSRYNYSSARLETQNYHRAITGLQSWISGTQRSVGTLNRLVHALAAEARFVVPALRRRPRVVRLQWTWPQRPHVDPTKEANAEAIALQNATQTLIDVLASRGEDLETHIAKLRRVIDSFEAAGLPMPQWGGQQIDQTMVDSLASALKEE